MGVGGTGAYVLDFVAKTPVREIHIFDGDVFLNHNAFRCPGAASIADLTAKPSKVAYLSSLYSRMRKRIVAHEGFVDAQNADVLKEMSFVFLCVDRGSAKGLIVDRLEQWNIPFIDVGMGVQLIDDAIGGVVTVTTSVPLQRDHFRARVALKDAEADNDYSRDVAIAELNALNASLAVIKWKKLRGYYHDLDREHFCAFTIDGNALTNGDKSKA